MAETASYTSSLPVEQRRRAEFRSLRAEVQRGLLPAHKRDYILRRALVVSDFAALALAAGGAILIQASLGRQVSEEWLLLAAALLPLWLPIGISARLYHVVGRGDMPALADDVGPVLRVATIWSWALVMARALVADQEVVLLPSLTLWALSVVAVLLVRTIVRLVARRCAWYRQRVLVIGEPEDAARVLSRLERHPEWGLDAVGTATFEEVTNSPNGDSEHASGNGTGAEAEPFARFLQNGESGLGSDVRLDDNGGTSAARQVQALVGSVRQREVARVIFASHPSGLSQRSTIARAMNASGVQVDLVPGDSEILRTNAQVHQLEGLPVISVPPASLPRSIGLVKRGFDLAVALPLLTLFTPVLLYSAIRIKLDSKGPVFYRQVRVGQRRGQFEFLKLRSMDEGADDRLAEVAERSLHGNGVDVGMFKAVDDPRVTRFGRWMRKWSVDELPQLWNVIRGDMSLVGPRPLPEREDRRVGEDFFARYEVRPGITGPWQVLGRSEIPFDDMVRLDYTYVMNWSLSEDVKLLVRTIAAVCGQRGAY